MTLCDLHHSYNKRVSVSHTTGKMSQRSTGIDSVCPLSDDLLNCLSFALYEYLVIVQISWLTYSSQNIYDDY